MENKLLITLGNTENGELVCDIEKVHHLFVSGQSGSGKSIFLHKAIKTVITQHDAKDLQIALIDPKHTEFCNYEGNVRIVGEKPIYDVEEALEFFNRFTSPNVEYFALNLPLVSLRLTSFEFVLTYLEMLQSALFRFKFNLPETLQLFIFKSPFSVEYVRLLI